MRALSTTGSNRAEIMRMTATRIRSLLRDDEGAQVVEYALIIAVVSIALVVALGDSASGLRSGFADLAARVGTCFSAGGTCI